MDKMMISAEWKVLWEEAKTKGMEVAWRKTAGASVGEGWE